MRIKILSLCLTFFNNKRKKNKHERRIQHMKNSKNNERENKKYLNNFVYLYIWIYVLLFIIVFYIINKKNT